MALIFVVILAGCGEDETSDRMISIGFIHGYNQEGIDPRDDFVVELNGLNLSGETVRVNYTVSGSAESGIDFEELPGFVEIAPNTTDSPFIVLQIIDDMEVEELEEIHLTLAPSDLPRGYSIRQDISSAMIYLRDND